jgi:hypothetical protein
MTIRKMLISYVKLDHTLYTINYGNNIRPIINKYLSTNKFRSFFRLYLNAVIVEADTALSGREF